MAEDKPYSLSMFTPLVGDTFRIQSDTDETVTLELVEAAGRAGGGESPPDTRNFAIVFQDHQATVDSHVPQSVYRLEHHELGALDLFLVPIGPGPGGQGIRYEAVFTSVEPA